MQFSFCGPQISRALCVYVQAEKIEKILCFKDLGCEALLYHLLYSSILAHLTGQAQLQHVFNDYRTVLVIYL